jgi:hypothetical protein
MQANLNRMEEELQSNVTKKQQREKEVASKSREVIELRKMVKESNLKLQSQRGDENNPAHPWQTTGQLVPPARGLNLDTIAFQNHTVRTDIIKKAIDSRSNVPSPISEPFKAPGHGISSLFQTKYSNPIHHIVSPVLSNDLFLPGHDTSDNSLTKTSRLLPWQELPFPTSRTCPPSRPTQQYPEDLSFFSSLPFTSKTRKSDDLGQL